MCVPAYNVNTPGDLTGTAPNGEPILVHYDEVGHIADPNSGLNIEPGCQRLGGDQALAYVRARHLPCDHVPDFARIGRQQQFLRAVVNQMLQPAMVLKAPALVGPVLENLRRDVDLLPSDLVYLVGQLRGLSTGAVEFRAVPGVAAQEGTKAVLRMDPSAHEIFRAIRRGRPIGDVGTQLVNTPPSEANTRVAVVDADSEGSASAVESVLSDAGFDVTPGIWSVSEASLDVTGPAIVFRPQASAEAEVVAAYFPDLALVASEDLRGAQVAIVVDATYSLVRPGQGGGNGGTRDARPSRRRSGGGAAARRLQRQAVGGDLPPRRLLGRERPSSYGPGGAQLVAQGPVIEESTHGLGPSVHVVGANQDPGAPQDLWQRGGDRTRSRDTPDSSPRRAGDRIPHRSTGTRAPPTPGTTPRASRRTRAPAAGRSGTGRAPRSSATRRHRPSRERRSARGRRRRARRPPWRTPPGVFGGSCGGW